VSCGCARLLHDDQKESGFLPVLARLIKGFSHKLQPLSHAGDLVETLHLVLRLLERLSRQGAPPGCSGSFTRCVRSLQAQRERLAWGWGRRPSFDFQPGQDALRSSRSSPPTARAQRRVSSW